MIIDKKLSNFFFIIHLFFIVKNNKNKVNIKSKFKTDKRMSEITEILCCILQNVLTIIILYIYNQ